jgi:hypothetical protein
MKHCRSQDQSPILPPIFPARRNHDDVTWEMMHTRSTHFQDRDSGLKLSSVGGRFCCRRRLQLVAAACMLTREQNGGEAKQRITIKTTDIIKLQIV